MCFPLLTIRHADRYYCNHNTGECTWTPPRRGVSFLHPPQDYVMALENDNLYYVKWSISSQKPHIRTWTKPAGYLRCTSCLQNLALISCTAASGAFCFRCFRGTFDAVSFLHGSNRQQRVGPVMCGVCKKARLAAWRCTGDARYAGLAACVKCYERLAATRTWLRL